MTRDIFDLKYRADANNLRNRSFEPEPIVVRLDSVDECECGAPLLITDRGSRCRQCVLQGRMSDPKPRWVLNGVPVSVGADESLCMVCGATLEAKDRGWTCWNCILGRLYTHKTGDN